MILRNKAVGNEQLAVGNRQLTIGKGQQAISKKKIRSHKVSLLLICILLFGSLNKATCKYGFKDVSLPTEVKTFRVNYFENKADYKNPQLSPQLTEKLKQKIISTTRLQQTNGDEAHYDISGYVSAYFTSTTGISANNTSLNRLTATFHLIFRPVTS